MRHFGLVLLISLGMAAGSILPTVAAPTSQDANGTTTRCGTPNAMPVGWQLSAEEFHQRQEALGNVFDSRTLMSALALIAALFAIITLLPDFDGRSGNDWDEQEGDRPRRR